MTRESIETLLDATRLAGLETTEGGRILGSISRPDAKGTGYRTALVEIDGERDAPVAPGARSAGAGDAPLCHPPRLAGLETTEGGRILASSSRPDAKGTGYRTALVEIDGERNVPLTRGAASVGAVAAAEDGTTFFTAKRLGEDGEE